MAGMGSPLLTARDPSARLVGWIGLCALGRGGLATDVIDAQKISNLEGGLAAFYTLGNGDHFGSSVVALGDVNGDGITDLAVGARGDGDGGSWGMGAVYVLFMNVTVIGAQKISNDYGGLSAFYTLYSYVHFGTSLAALGDWDGDGIPDMAVGAPGDDDHNRGSVCIIFLNSDGTAKAATKISRLNLTPFGSGWYNQFGSSIAAIGDLNSDGIADLAVGAHNDGGLVGQAFETTVPLAPGAQLAFPYDNEWWRIRGLRRLDAGCGAFPLPRRDPARRRAAARAREGRRLDALLPILAPFLDEGTCSLVELGCGSSGGLPLALAATRRRFRRGGVVGVASAAATRALLAKACARATFVASAAAVAVAGADVVVAPTKSAAADANAARLARRTLRDGGALVVEASGDDDAFLAWVRRAARVLGGGRATMHRSAPDCAVYVFERAGAAGGVDVEVRDYD